MVSSGSRTTLLVPAVVVVAVLLLSAAVPGAEGRMFIRSRVMRGEAGGASPATGPTNATAKYFDGQAKDHSNPGAGTWSQRYFVNDTWFDGTGPVFLCMGGETPLYNDVVVTGSYHCGFMVSVLAQNSSALIVALEHRYYGSSMPTPAHDTESLKAYMSTQQAIGDIASFIGHISDVYGLTGANKVVTFGGSYPGMVAAFARLKLPHLVHASIASSAPVQGRAHFVGYMDVVAKSMGAAIVGGSPECQDILRSGFSQVGEMLTSSRESRAELAEDFYVCPGPEPQLENEANWPVFTETLSGLLPVQENDPACTAPVCNIASVCRAAMDVMNNGGSPYSAIVKIGSLATNGGASGCLNVSYAAQVEALANPTPVLGSPDAMGRTWTFQTCTEYGYYQTCDPGSECLTVSYPHVNNLTSYFAMCESAFGINASTTYAGIQATNAWSGGWDPKGSRILWVNGSIDPWHALSITEPVNGMPALWVDGSSHHFWTHPPLPSDSPEIKQARRAIAAQLDAWLNESSSL